MTKAQGLLIQLKEATKKKYHMSKTYETWDEDSTEAGETDERGFEYEDNEFDSLWAMAEEIRDAGATEPSDSHRPSPHTWYSTVDPEHNRAHFEKGEDTYYSFHPKGISQEEAEELFKLVKMPHTEFGKLNPEDQEEESEEDAKDALERECEKKNARLPFD